MSEYPRNEQLQESYLSNESIVAALQKQGAEMGPLTPAQVKAHLREIVFPGENPTV